MIYVNSGRRGPAVNWRHGWICNNHHAGDSGAHSACYVTVSSKETVPAQEGISFSDGHKTENY